MSDDTSYGSEGGDQVWDEWQEQDDDADAVKSLFDDKILPSVDAALEYDARTHSFDFRQFRLQAGLSDYETVQCINFIRSEVASGRDPRPRLQQPAATDTAPWKHDKYFQPVLPEDALLFFDFDDEYSKEDYEDGEDMSKEERLSAEVAALKQLLQQMMDKTLDGPSQKQIADGTADVAGCSGSGQVGADRVGSTIEASSSAAPQDARALNVLRVDKSYFDSYASFGIHWEMLKDTARTDSYRMALECNHELVQGATVLDVGCGTAILSMFAARAGAQHVIGVEGSEQMAQYARRICEINGLSSDSGGPISIVSGKLEELECMPHAPVDVIVSEWMGYALLFETMLDTVLVARDRWLRPGGAILPDLASLHCALTTYRASGLDMWHKMYGFDMTVVAFELHNMLKRRPSVQLVDSDFVVSNTATIKQFDLTTMQPSDTDFTVEVQLELADQSSDAAPADCDALVIWFDVDFSPRFCRAHPVTLSTAPNATATHWVQTLLTFREPIRLQARSGSESSTATSIVCRISMDGHTRHRVLEISLEVQPVFADGRRGTGQAMSYRLGVHEED